MDNKEELKTGFYVKRMYTEVLGLTGCELYTFALIAGFCENAKQSVFFGTRQYIAKCIGASVSSVDRALKALCKRGLIAKATVTYQDRPRVHYTLNSRKISELELTFALKKKTSSLGMGKEGLAYCR